MGYLLLNNGSDEVRTTTATDQQISTSPESEPAQPTKEGSYVDYIADAVANTQGTRILFFHAPWCPQCRQLESSIKAGKIPADVTIFKVDYDSNQKLRQQYGVTIQATLVVLGNEGNEAKKYVAYDKPNLDAVIENLL